MAVVPMPPKRRPAAPAPAPAPASARTDDALKDQAAALAKPEDAQASAGSAPRPAPALSNRPGRKEEPPSTPSRSGGQGTAADPPDVGVAAAAGRLKGEAETTGRPDGRTVPGRLRPRPDRRLTSDTGGLAPRTRPVVGAAVAAEPVAAADATAARATPAVIVPPAASAAADRSETAKAAAGAGSGRGAKPAPQDPQPSEDETVALTAATQPPDESETAEVPPPRQSLPATATTAVQPSRPRSDRPQPEPENSPRKDRAAASNRPRSDRQTGGAAERQTGGPASRQAEGPDDRQSGEAVFLVDGAQPVLSGFAPLVAGALVTRRYRLLTQLRHTSAVDSWQATDEKLDRLVVVHALADETAADAIIVAARRAATATDARFVRVLDAVADADGLYVITEWAEGTPLAEVLQSGPLTGLEAAWLVKEAAEPLSAVHPLGLFHQRLDATRVLITPTGGVRIAGLVTDAVFNPDPADEAKTRSELEQADVTALGRLLYACLTALWPGSEPTGLPEAPLGAFGYASPRRIQPAASAALDRLADQILAATPRAGHPRLATAAQVLTALSQTLGAANPTADLAHRVLVTGPIQASRPALGAGAAIQPVIVPALGTATGSGAKAADTAASRSDAASRNQPDHTAATGRAAAASDAGRPAAEPPDSAGPHRHAATGQAGLTAAGRTAAGPLASGRATGCPTTTGRPAAEQAAAVSDSSHSNAAASTSSGAGSSKSGAARPGGGRTTAGQATAAAPAGLARFGSGGARRVGLIVLAVIVALAVVAAIIANLSRGAGDDNDDSDNSTEPSQSAAALTPVAVQTIRSFNPVGGGEENEILVGQAIDGNLATDWHTVVYGNSPDFGGLGLGGVGLVVDFGGPVAIRQAKLQLTNSPSPVMLLVPLAADLTEPPFDSITAWTPVAQDSTQPPAAYDPAGPAPSTVVIDCDTTTRFLLVYFHDKLPYLNATQYQTGISEMSFYG